MIQSSPTPTHDSNLLSRIGITLAALALYLCSDEASFITGQAYPIDGGVVVF